MNKSVLKFVALVNGLLAVNLTSANPIVNISYEIDSNNNYDYNNQNNYYNQNNYNSNYNTNNNYNQNNNNNYYNNNNNNNIYNNNNYVDNTNSYNSKNNYVDNTNSYNTNNNYSNNYNSNVDNTNNNYSNNYNSNVDNTNNYYNNIDNSNNYNGYANNYSSNVDNSNSYTNSYVNNTNSYNTNTFENTNTYNTVESNASDNYSDTNFNPNDFLHNGFSKYQMYYTNYDTFKATWIYNTNSNLCLTYYKVNYKLRLEPCNKNNVYQKWYVPIQGYNYWILGTTLSPSTNKDVMTEVNVEANSIEEYFDYNTICLFSNSKGSFLSNTCIMDNYYSGVKMDPINFGSSENVIKASWIHGNNCVDVLPEDVDNYNKHINEINTSLSSNISPLDLTVNSIRLTMRQCNYSDSQKWSFFVNFSDLQNFQKAVYNPNNYSTITELKADVTDIYIKPNESKKINLQIMAGNKKITKYSNIKVTIGNSKIASASRSNVTITVTGKTVGSTTITVQVHKKKLVFNVIVNDVTDKITVLDIQTYDDPIGDCIVIQSSNAKGTLIYGMIDTGKNRAVSYNKILGYLKENNVKQLKWILLTHFHDDHTGGIYKLLENGIKVKKIYTKKYRNLDSTIDTSKYNSVADFRKDRKQRWNTMVNTINSKNIPIAYISANANDNVQLGNYKFKFFNVNEAFENYGETCVQFKNCNENTNSIVTVVQNNGKYYYLNGDIDTYSTSFSKSKDENLKKAYNQRTVDKWVTKAMKYYNIKQIDVMKASHHGVLYNNIQSAFVAAKAPIGIVTRERESMRDRIDVLEKRFKAGNKNVKIYYSGNGSITISQDKKGKISVIQGRDEHNE